MISRDINKRIRFIMRLRTMGITDTRVLSAMERVPRDCFVPPAVKDRAWEDMALPIGRGQTISQPFIVAAMSEALNISDRDKVLEIGTGAGIRRQFYLIYVAVFIRLSAISRYLHMRRKGLKI